MLRTFKGQEMSFASSIMKDPPENWVYIGKMDILKLRNLFANPYKEDKEDPHG